MDATGTKYYLIYDYCQHCNRGTKRCLLGLQNLGWKFLFQAQDTINSFAEYVEIVVKGNYKIQDEYGHVMSLADFITMVNRTQDGLSTRKYNGPNYSESKELWEKFKDDYFTDDQGYDFSKKEID